MAANLIVTRVLERGEQAGLRFLLLDSDHGHAPVVQELTERFGDKEKQAVEEMLAELLKQLYECMPEP